MLLSGASACVELYRFEEAITWCDKGLAVSFDIVIRRYQKSAGRLETKHSGMFAVSSSLVCLRLAICSNGFQSPSGLSDFEVSILVMMGYASRTRLFDRHIIFTGKSQ